MFPATRECTLPFFALVTTLLVAAAAPVAAAPLTDGLIAHYKLDSANNPVVDSAGTLDGTNNGATLTTANSPTFGNALEFDGVDDRIDFSQSIHTGTGDFSIFAWVRTSPGFSDGQSHHIVNYGTTIGQGAPANINEELYLGMDPFGAFKFDLRASSGPVSTALINDGDWHSVGVVHSAGTVQLYVDGVADGSALMSPNIVAGDAAIGGTTDSLPSGNTVLYWDGAIDDVGVWGRALDSDEIAFVAINPIPEPSTALLVALGLVGIGVKRRPAWRQ